MSEEKNPRPRPIRRILSVTGAVLLAVIVYLVFILTKPTDSTGTDVETQPLLTASPVQSLTQLSDLQSLAAAFPVPVLMAASGSGLTLESGGSYDVAFENGVGRILSLNYRTENGIELQVDSIYPARALTLMDGSSYRLIGSGQTVAGQSTVRMESSTHIRLHMQTSKGLYVITIPKGAQDELSSAATALRLYNLQ